MTDEVHIELTGTQAWIDQKLKSLPSGCSTCGGEIITGKAARARDIGSTDASMTIAYCPTCDWKISVSWTDFTGNA